MWIWLSFGLLVFAEKDGHSGSGIDYKKIHDTLKKLKIRPLPKLEDLQSQKDIRLSHRKVKDEHVDSITKLPEVLIWVLDATLLTEKSISYFSRTTKAYTFASAKFKYFTVERLRETFKNHKNIKAILLSEESDIDVESEGFKEFLNEHSGLKVYFGEKEKNDFKRHGEVDLKLQTSKIVRKIKCFKRVSLSRFEL
jgi:hypothetical protein